MAVAVKNPETRKPTETGSVQLRSLVGLAILLAGLVAVFWAIPTFLPPALRQVLPRENAITAIVLFVELLAAVALIYLATVVIGAGSPGVRAGAFVTLGALLGMLFVGSWFGGVIEWMFFDKNLLGGIGKPIGMGISAAFVGILLVMYLRWFFAKGTAGWLKEFEEGGWFSWTSYKGQQGVRVRRATIMGILLLGGAGIYTMVTHGSLNSYDTWSVGVPFTGTIPIGLEPRKGNDGQPIKLADGQLERLPALDSSIGDAGPLMTEKLKWDGKSVISVDRWLLRDDINPKLDRTNFVAVKLDQTPLKTLYSEAEIEKYGLAPNKRTIVPRQEFETKIEEAKANNTPIDLVDKVDYFDPVPAGNPSGRKNPERLYAGDTLKYTSVPLLPQVKFTLPLVLTALLLWLSWRIVNYPPFADFLIATEAEMNKVSWTTRRRLFQDTIVVLVTVLLMAGFLLIADLTCRSVLGHPWVGVIQINKDAETSKKSTGPRPW